MALRVLVIHSDPRWQERLNAIISRAQPGTMVAYANSQKNALSTLNAFQFDAIIVGNMDDDSKGGRDLAAVARQIGKDTGKNTKVFRVSHRTVRLREPFDEVLRLADQIPDYDKSQTAFKRIFVRHFGGAIHTTPASLATSR